MKKLVQIVVFGWIALNGFSGNAQNTTISSQWVQAPRNSYSSIKLTLSPVTGMMIYDTTNNCLRIYTGNSWDCLTSSKTNDCPTPLIFTQRGGGTGSYNDDDLGNDAAIDKDGNVYATGNYQGNAVFGTTTLTPLGSYGSDLFLVKYNPDSTVAWAVKAGGSNDDNGTSVTVDTLGNSYITGYFNSSATFYGTDAFTISKTATSYDMFVAKYNSSGVLQSVYTIPADYGYGIATDNSGNVYVTGEYSGSFSLNAMSYSPVGDNDVFVMKMNAAGTVLWFKSFGSTGKDEGADIIYDVNTNKVFVVGSYSGTTNFGANTLSSSGDEDVFVARFDASTGANEWVVKGGGTYDDRGRALVMENNNLYVIGWFQGSCLFGTAPLSSNSSSRDVFIASYATSTGNLNWISQAGGSGEDIGANIALDNEGNIFTIGNFYGTANFGALALSSAGNTDVFMAKLNSSGGFLKAIKGGGTGNDYGQGIAANGCGVFLLGGFNGTAQFGRSLTSAGGFDAFLWKTER